MGLLKTNERGYYRSGNFGTYQFTTLDDIINYFIVAYVGEDKIISKVKRTDVAFHAQRALAELSFDTFKSCKAQEFAVPPTLQMPVPQDYVNYTKISWVDANGIKRLLYPVSKTSNPGSNPIQNDDGDFKLEAVGDLIDGSNSITLNDEYKDIIVGMRIVGPYIPSGAVVSATSNSGGITTIEMEVGGVAADATESNSDTTIEFFNNVQDLPPPFKSSHIVEDLSWNALDFKITASSATDIANLEVGMRVSHEYFQPSTVITNISGTTIVVDKLPSQGQALGAAGDEVTFYDPNSDTDTWSKYKGSGSSSGNDNYDDDDYWLLTGGRHGIDPQYAQANGSFYIDCITGKIHFSSNVSGRTVILDYISDTLGRDDEMQVHKFAEEAMYKCIAYAILSTRSNVQEYIIRRYKKERFAEVRKAKLRLSNIKLEEITQILRGKSKQIKH